MPTRMIFNSDGWSDGKCVAWILRNADNHRNLSPDQKRELLARKKKTAFDDVQGTASVFARGEGEREDRLKALN
jgi:hypothetical protein